MKRSTKRALGRFFLLLLLPALIVLAWFGFNAYRKVYVPFQGFRQRAVVRIDSGAAVEPGVPQPGLGR